ncbi:MAG: hypothetical protein RLZZ360_786 [Candidatus Parcubacteria bacterium]
MSLDVPEFAAAARHILAPECYLRPKVHTMIEMLAMTELVNDDVACEMLWQEKELVVKIEIAFDGTATPATLGVFDRHATIGHTDTLCLFCNHR